MSCERHADIAVLLFESTSPTPPDRRSLYREDITLVYGSTEDEAREEAERHARAQESTYEAVSGDTVTLRFVQTVDLVPALDDDLTTTADLYCRRFREIDLYRRGEPLLDGRVATTSPQDAATARRPCGSAPVAGGSRRSTSRPRR